MIEVKKAIKKSCTLTIDGDKKVFEIIVKDALMARRCAGCGSIFEMRNYPGMPEHPGVWTARMSGTAGREGNIFLLDCCSFSCAHDLECGGWKKPKTKQAHDIQAARDYAKANIITLFVEYTLGEVMYEDDLIQEWEARKLKTPILDIAFAEDKTSPGYHQPNLHFDPIG